MLASSAWLSHSVDEGITAMVASGRALHMSDKRLALRGLLGYRKFALPKNSDALFGYESFLLYCLDS